MCAYMCVCNGEEGTSPPKFRSILEGVRFSSPRTRHYSSPYPSTLYRIQAHYMAFESTNAFRAGWGVCVYIQSLLIIKQDDCQLPPWPGSWGRATSWLCSQ